MVVVAQPREVPSRSGRRPARLDAARRDGGLVAGERALVAIAALLFAVSTAVTVAWCRSMSAIGDMRMPGGWTMSMAWMRRPGQT